MSWRHLVILISALIVAADGLSWKQMSDNLNKLSKDMDDVLLKLQSDHGWRDSIKRVVDKVTKNEARRRLSSKILEAAFMFFDEAPGDFARETEFLKSKKYRSPEAERACDTLGVDCDSLTSEELRRVCRRSKSEWHPDRHAEKDKDEARSRFYDIQGACEVLHSQGL